MKVEEIQEIIESMPGNRLKFYYFKDRYALMLLAGLVGDGMHVREIKSSRYKRLVDKPVVKELLQRSGQAVVSRELFYTYWPRDYLCYRLGLASWGGKQRWSRFSDQTSRSGSNLVLQLNFSSQHDNSYRRLIRPEGGHPFENKSHPIAGDGCHTLAWARIDLDLDSDEALIEEIQTDWIRLAKKSRQAKMLLESGKVKKPRHLPSYLRMLGCDSEALSAYVDNELDIHARIWPEAMLAAAISFLREQIGINNIYYHTFESGYTLKRINGRKPPRSLYTTLPEKFCFDEIGEPPVFLLNGCNRRKVRLLEAERIHFFRLSA